LGKAYFSTNSLHQFTYCCGRRDFVDFGSYSFFNYFREKRKINFENRGRWVRLKKCRTERRNGLKVCYRSNPNVFISEFLTFKEREEEGISWGISNATCAIE
jgi:hypothetical protein